MKKTPVLSLKTLHEINYTGCLDVTYDSHCNNECSDDDYCRCSTIENIKIHGVSLTAAAKVTVDTFFFKKDPMYDFLVYAVERIFRKNHVYDESSWDVEVNSGYYGEEIGNKTLINADARKAVFELFQLTSVEDIMQHLLEMEYGYLLPSLQNVKFDILEISLSDVVRSQLDHAARVDAKHEKYYEGHTLPIGIVTQNGKEYRLIDGYHRVSAALKESQKTAEFIVAIKV